MSREQLPALSQAVYLNTGTLGPMPVQVHAAMARALDQQVLKGRLDVSYFSDLADLRAGLRSALAGMIGCSPGEVAITQNTTDGMNIISLGMNWQPGDEAITTNLEHAGALLPLYAARDRFGITVKVADVLSEPARSAEIIERMITHRTKLISLSHVAFTTGARLPVKAVCDAAHRHGVLVLVDGAQAFAAVPVNVADLGCDFYALPGQKWVCGPEGVGALYVDQRVVSQVRVTFAGYYSVDQFSTHGGFLARDNAWRFEQDTVQPALLAGYLAACRWLIDEVGTEAAFARVRGLARYARESLMALPGVKVLTPADAAGLVTFQVEVATNEAVAMNLVNQGILVRPVPHPGGVRISTGFYNTEDEIGRAVAAVAAMTGGA